MSFATINQSAQTNDTTPGQIQLFCTADKLGVSVSIGGGDNATGGQRRMTNGSGGYLPYNIHSDVGRGSALAIGGTIYSGNVTAAVGTLINIWGSVPAGAYSAGAYADNLVVVFNY